MDKLTPRMPVPGSGATSDMEMRTFRNALPSLMKQPGGNAIVADTYRGILDYQAQVGDIASKALRGEIGQADADKAIREVPMLSGTRRRSLALWRRRPASWRRASG